MSWLSPIWRSGPSRGGPSIESLVREGFVAIDLETTGLDPTSDAIVSMAAVTFIGGQPRDGFTTLVNPRCLIPESSTRIHGITDAMVADAPFIEEALSTFDLVCGDELLVGHALDFDLAMLARARRLAGFAPITNPVVDTARVLAWMQPPRPSMDLADIAQELGVPVNGRHTARGDAVIAGRVILALVPRLAGRGVRTVAELRWIQDAR